MKKIGLTGGIASGKSLVADEFKKLGIDVIDTDVIAREIVEPGTECLKQITHHFGKKVLNSDDSLNRASLRNIIFNKPDEKLWLENLMHPEIRKVALARTKQSNGPYCIIDIPLLIETKADYQLDKIIVVDAPEDSQLKRLMERDQISETDAQKILNSQADRVTRLKYADFVIENHGSTEDLAKQVSQIHSNII